MSIKPITRGNLQTVLDSDWFRSVGTLQSDEKKRALTSWEEASKSALSEQWLGLLQEAANQYTTRLFERDRERYNRWNKIVEIVKSEAMPLVQKKIDAYLEAARIPVSIVPVIQWDVLHFCMECEYDDVFPVGFYAAQMFWYTQGNFPCGWEGGEFPKNGLRLVF
jgi:hypothetical protein